MLEGCLLGTRRTRRAADRRRLTAGDWADERKGAWDLVRERVAQAVSLFHRKRGYHVLVFTDASDMHWGGCVTQVLTTEFVEGVRLNVANSGWTNGTVERMMREPYDMKNQ